MPSFKVTAHQVTTHEALVEADSQAEAEEKFYKSFHDGGAGRDVFWLETGRDLGLLRSSIHSEKATV